MSIILRPSTEEDKRTLPWIDYSGLTALNTCPRWGLIHSVHGKRFQALDRSMALEAGSAMHDMFAAVRMFELMDHVLHDGPMGMKGMPEYIFNHGAKLFRSPMYDNRWNDACDIFLEKEDYDTRLMRFALYILETSGFHDDPSDRRRTQTNLESAAISYIDKYPKRRYIPFTDAGRNFVGVEIGIDVVLNTSPAYRFVGKVDGLCIDTMQRHRPIGIHENKTGSRIDMHWASAFTVGHQPTGYMAAISAMLDTQVDEGVAWGLQIPVPKSSAYGDGSMRVPLHRNERQVQEWFQWVQHTLDVAMPYLNDPTNAPMYTHSCNRYFRSCSLIPLCAEEPEQRKHTYEQEMVSDRWSPLAELEGEK